MARRNGFTLVELLITVAIIAILAAVFAAVISSAKRKGRQTACASNIRQIALAMQNYVDDWQGAFPFPCNEQDPGIWWSGTWRQRILPYCKTGRMFKCPEPTKEPDVYAMGGYDLGHYGMNCMLTHYPYTRVATPLPFGFSYMHEVAQPSLTILITENKDGDWSGEPDSTYYGDSGPSGHFWPYHSDGGVWVFCDGHTRWMPVGQADRDNFYLWRKTKY